MDIKKNVKEGIKTTIFGSVLVLAGIVSVFVLPDVDWTGASIAIGMGLGLIFGFKK